jgi:hypothetical protein
MQSNSLLLRYGHSAMALRLNNLYRMRINFFLFYVKILCPQNGGFSKGNLARPRLLRQGISRGYRECELGFSTKFAKKNNIET